MVLRHLFLWLLAVSNAASLFGQMNEEEVILSTPTGEIFGSLWIPTEVERPPIVLIIAGSGPTDRNGNFPMGVNNSLKLLAEGLSSNGIASLRYDKRGIGQSAPAGKAESEMRFEDYVEDAVLWGKMLQDDPRFRSITILGHSEGSLIGMMAAKRIAANKFVSIAGPGVPAGVLIRNQLKEQPPTVLEQALPILEQLEEGNAVTEIPQVLFPLFRPSAQPYMISWFKYDPKEELSKLECPVLIVQGNADLQVSVSDAHKLSMANPQTQKKIIEEMNHVLKTTGANRMENLATYTNPDLPLTPSLIPTLAAFINK